MKELSFYGLLSHPSVWEPDAFYYIDSGSNAESYVVGSDGVPRNIGNTTMITNIVDYEINKISVVNTIPERDLLILTKNALVLVLDSSADPSVGSGSAIYIYDKLSASWFLVSSYESISKIVTNLEWDILTGNLTLTYNSGSQIVNNLDGRYRLSTKIDDVINVGVTVVHSLPSSLNGCFIDYSMTEGANKRVGRLVAVWDATSSVFHTEYSSPEIGEIKAYFNLIRVGSNIQLRVFSTVHNVAVSFLITHI